MFYDCIWFVLLLSDTMDPPSVHSVCTAHATTVSAPRCSHREPPGRNVLPPVPTTATHLPLAHDGSGHHRGRHARGHRDCDCPPSSLQHIVS